MLHIRVRFFSTLFRFATDVAIGNRRFQCVPTPLRLLHFPCKQPRFGFSFFKQFGLGLICTTSGAGWMVGSGLTHSYAKIYKKNTRVGFWACVVCVHVWLIRCSPSLFRSVLLPLCCFTFDFWLYLDSHTFDRRGATTSVRFSVYFFSALSYLKTEWRFYLDVGFWILLCPRDSIVSIISFCVTCTISVDLFNFFFTDLFFL